LAVCSADSVSSITIGPELSVDFLREEIGRAFGVEA